MASRFFLLSDSALFESPLGFWASSHLSCIGSLSERVSDYPAEN